MTGQGRLIQIASDPWRGKWVGSWRKREVLYAQGVQGGEHSLVIWVGSAIFGFWKKGMCDFKVLPHLWASVSKAISWKLLGGDFWSLKGDLSPFTSKKAFSYLEIEQETMTCMPRSDEAGIQISLMWQDLNGDQADWAPMKWIQFQRSEGFGSKER